MVPEYPTAQNPSDPSSYFVSEEDELKNIERKRKINTILQSIRYYAIKVWPFVNRVVQTVVYFMVNLIRGIVKIAIDQIKNFKG